MNFASLSAVTVYKQNVMSLDSNLYNHLEKDGDTEW